MELFLLSMKMNTRFPENTGTNIRILNFDKAIIYSQNNENSTFKAYNI